MTSRLGKPIDRDEWFMTPQTVNAYYNPSNNDPRNLASLCGPCHSRKTQADMGKRVNWGCDVNGMPLDPNHPWRLS